MAIEQEIVTWLEQHSVTLHLQDVAGRKAFLFAAGLDELQNTLALEGVTSVFCRNVVQQLRQYGALPDGRDPLTAVLEAAKTMVGSDRQAECDAFIARLHAAGRAADSPHARQRQQKKRIIIGIMILITLLAMIAIGYHYSRTPQPQPVIPEAKPVTPSTVYNNTTAITPNTHNSATTHGDKSPAIVGDGATVNY